LAIPGIESIEVSARTGDRVIPLPEESSYLGFVFASGNEPEFVTSALREVRDKLRIKVKEILNLEISAVANISAED